MFYKGPSVFALYQNIKADLSYNQTLYQEPFSLIQLILYILRTSHIALPH